MLRRVPWRGDKATFCKACGKRRKPGEVFTARGNHLACGDLLMRTNAIQLHQHSGPFFDHWRKQCLAAFGVVTLDESAKPAQTAD